MVDSFDTEDFKLAPLSLDARTSPKRLAEQLSASWDAAAHARCCDPGADLSLLAEPTRTLLRALGISAEPGNAAVVLFPLQWQDPGAASRLARMAYEGLRGLDRAECLETLADLGASRYRGRIEVSLTQILRLASQPQH